MLGGPMEIRFARPDDAAAVAEIYAQGIAGRQATFETEPPSPSRFADRIAGGEPLIVAEEDGQVVGWASILQYNPRAVYAGVGEYTVYVHEGWRGRSVGHALIERLLELAVERGYYKLMSRIFPSNRASLALAARHGFREVGVHRRHARLDGEWRDVIVVEVLIGEAAL
jgi:L-amino acid N-acyltransferase YncA